MTRRALSLMMLFIPLALAACIDPGPNAGVVIEHQYDDPDEYYVQGIHIPGSCSTNNGVQTCSPGIQMPGYWDTEPERFLLVLEDDEGKRGSVTVGREMWDAIQDGQHYDHKTGKVTSR